MKIINNKPVKVLTRRDILENYVPEILTEFDPDILNLATGVYKGKTNGFMPNGQGVMIYNNTDIYKGNFKNSLKHGEGLLKTKTYTYKGFFQDRRLHGMGIYKSQMESYEGFYQFGKKHG